MRNTWFLIFVLGGVVATVKAQFPVSGLCAGVRCPSGNVCRVFHSCPSPFCLPTPNCVPCVPRGVDAVCNRNRYISTVLLGSPLSPQSVAARVCTLLSATSCPFDSICLPDGAGQGRCCYSKPPPGLPAINPDPLCPVNRCLPSCPPGTTCQRVTLCPFFPPCFDEFQCRPVGVRGGIGLGLGLGLELGLGLGVNVGGSDS